MSRYAIGVDFGTESGRAILVDVADGTQLATAVYPYSQRRHRRAAARSRTATSSLPPDWALQDPDDYLRVFQTAVPAVLRDGGVDPADVIGIGIDFTACTMLPATADGTPLCRAARAPREPARLGQALEAPRRPARGRPDQRGRARDRARPGCDRYGGKISSEWFFAKALQILDEAPEVYARGRPADRGGRLGRLAADRRRDPQRLHRRLQGDVVEARRLPRPRLLRGARPAPRRRRRHEDVARPRTCSASGPAACPSEAAAWTGLPAGHRGRGRQRRRARRRPGRDRHRARPDGHDHGHLDLPHGPRRADEHDGARACAATSRTGSCPGFFGYEAGQSCVGDHFAWFVEHAVPERYHAEARERGHRHPRPPPGEGRRASRSASPGCSRSTGGTATARSSSTRSSAACSSGRRSRPTPEEIYRALIEATAYGTRVIIETFEANGVPDQRDRRLRRPGREEPADHADLRRRHRPPVPAERLGPDAGPRLGDVRGGRGRARPPAATPRSRTRARAMARLKDESTSRSRRTATVYDVLYREYVRLHDYFGRGENDVMKTLRGLRAGEAASTGRSGGLTMRLEALRRGARPAARRAAAPRPRRLDRRQRQRPRPGDRARGDQAVRRPLRGPDGRVDGRPRPRRAASSRARTSRRPTRASHLYIYRHRPDVNGVVHTHSRYATAFAAVGRPIPVYLTAQADEFGGEIPCAGFALIGDEAIGAQVVEGDRAARRRSCSRTTASSRSARRPTAAVKAAVMAEDVAATGLGRAPDRPARRSSPDDVVERLHHRYTTCYGQ